MIRTITVTALLYFGCSALHAQQVRIPGLENNATYVQLLNEQQQLKQTEDSTLTQIQNNRRLFSEQSSERTKYGNEIVRLESELYEVRNRIGKITSQIAAIEQDFILNRMDQQSEAPAVSSGTPSSRNLFDNPVFRENLSKAEIQLLNGVPAALPRMAAVRQEIDTLYARLTTLKGRYDSSADQDEIDTIALQADMLKEKIEKMDGTLEKIWLTAYNRKTDLYPVLLDKLGNIDRLKLEQFDQEGRLVRRAEGLAGSQLAPLLTTYPLQQQLAIDGELLLAERLQMKAAADSLRAARRMIAMSKDYPDIHFAPRSLVVYSPIEHKIESQYPSAADIPALKLPKTGLYYSVQLMALASAPKEMSTFKGVEPLRQETMADGRVRYLAGGFRNYAEAQKAQSEMVKAGFRTPTVVVWMDGKPTTVTRAKTIEATEQAKQAAADAGKRFTVQITPSAERLPAILRDIIEDQGAGPILRRNLNGAVVYTVGNFKSRADAETLIGALAGNSTAKIQLIEL